MTNAAHRAKSITALFAVFFLVGACAPTADGEAPEKQPAAPSIAGDKPETPGAGAASLPDFTALIEQQGPAVVNVVTSRDVGPGVMSPFGQLPDDPFFDFFRRFIPMPPPGEGQGGTARGIGSGFIIDAEGLILTNAHVVADADTVLVRLSDGKREFEGKVLGADSRTDVALVKIEASGLPVARLGNSEAVKPGQWVAAIGSPFGFTNTITAGIVSATERALPDETFVPFIQTDVAVNPGNSGGPLLNARGEVIGINSMIYSQTGGYMGVSFAIPIELALDVARQLREHGKVTRGRIGVAIQEVTPELAKAFGLDSARGVLVGSVEPDGPADEAGLRTGDVILAYNGERIEEADELPRLVAATKPGTEARLEVWRDGQTRTLTVTVGEFPTEEVAQAAVPGQAQEPNRLGLVLGEIPPAQRRELGIDYGLRVEQVTGAAAASPIQPGDVIVAINRNRIASAAEFERMLAQAKPGEPVALLVRRGEAALYVALTVPPKS